jgi:hypothetical protein
MVTGEGTFEPVAQAIDSKGRKIKCDPKVILG